VAQHPALTQLLLDRGADPNDVESPYHVPETDDNKVLKILLACGRLNEDSFATMLLRKADWHDLDGIELLLEQGANPNRTTQWGFNALHQALRRDNAIANIELMLDFGADPALATRHDGHSAATIAARRGRGDVLALFEARGIPDRLQGVDRLIAACARNEESRIQAITNAEPQLAGELIAQGGKLLAEFAANGNAAGVGLLLDLGVDVRAVFREGDGYWQIAENSTALHVAAWRAQHATVQFLIERGAPVNERDGQGRTPLALAVRACVDSHWTHRRSPQSVKILLEAGAVVDGVQVPSGYGEVDELLRRHAARQ
jgi:ankyrin repeat protein